MGVRPGRTPAGGADAAQFGGLLKDVKTVMEWRGILDIIQDYKNAPDAPAKVRIGIDAAEFIIDKLEGEGSMPALRAIMSEAKHAMISEPHARRLVTNIATLFSRDLSRATD